MGNKDDHFYCVSTRQSQSAPNLPHYHGNSCNLTYWSLPGRPAVQTLSDHPAGPRVFPTGLFCLHNQQLGYLLQSCVVCCWGPGRGGRTMFGTGSGAFCRKCSVLPPLQSSAGDECSAGNAGNIRTCSPLVLARWRLPESQLHRPPIYCSLGFVCVCVVYFYLF